MSDTAEKMNEVEYEEHFFSARDGLRLFFRRWFRPNPKGLIAIVHGFAEHSGRYDELAEVLCKSNWSVAAMDYRGHGQSGGRRCHIDGFDEYLGDVASFLDEIERNGYTKPVILLGHSLGGLISIRYAQVEDERLRGVVLSSPFLGLAMKVPGPKAIAGRLVSKLVPALAMNTGLDPAWVSHDPEVVEKYRNDPLVGTIATARWFTEVLNAQSIALACASQLQVPSLILQAGEDRLASVESTQRFFDATGAEKKHFKLYPDYYHEIFNEVGRDLVFSDLTEWLESHP